MTKPKKDVAATKARIIAHMNADHTDSLTLYLRQHAHLSPQRAASCNPKLVDITLTNMSIDDGLGTTHSIPIIPHLLSYADARARTVSMDVAARKALGLPTPGPPPPVIVTRYVPPTSWPHLGMLALVFVFGFLMYLQSQNRIVKGTWFYDRFVATYPGGSAAYFRISKMIAYGAVMLHAGETVVMMRQLEEHGVSYRKGLFWAWVMSCMLEGWGAGSRFSDVVKEAEKARDGVVVKGEKEVGGENGENREKEGKDK